MRRFLLLPILLSSGCGILPQAEQVVPYEDGSYYTIVGGSSKERAFNMLVSVMKGRCESDGKKGFKLISTQNSQTGEVKEFETSKSTTKVGVFTFSSTDQEYKQGFDLEAIFKCI